MSNTETIQLKPGYMHLDPEVIKKYEDLTDTYNMNMLEDFIKDLKENHVGEVHTEGCADLEKCGAKHAFVKLAAMLQNHLAQLSEDHGMNHHEVTLKFLVMITKSVEYTKSIQVQAEAETLAKTTGLN